MQKEQIEQAERSELQPELMSLMKEEVGKARDNRMPIIRAFEAVAQRTGLKSNTIRNYYYRYLHVHEDKQTVPVGTAGSNGDESPIGRPFTPEETRELMKAMLLAQARGESVRGCANRLSNGDKRILIRLQNKYRSIIAREPDYVNNLINEMAAAGLPAYNPYTREKDKPGRYGSMDGNASGDELVGLISQFTSNMKGIGGNVLRDFVKGLRDISSLAARGARRGGRDSAVLEKERELKDLYNRLVLLEARAEREQQESNTLRSRYRSLVQLNRQFVELPDVEKLSALNAYVSKLQSHIQE